MNTTNEIDFLLEFTVSANGWMARIFVLRSQFLVALDHIGSPEICLLGLPSTELVIASDALRWKSTPLHGS